MNTCLNSRDEPVHYLAASATEKINGDDLGKTPLKLGKIGLDLRRAIVLGLAFRCRNLSEPASFDGQ